MYLWLIDLWLIDCDGSFTILLHASSHVLKLARSHVLKFARTHGRMETHTASTAPAHTACVACLLFAIAPRRESTAPRVKAFSHGACVNAAAVQNSAGVAGWPATGLLLRERLHELVEAGSRLAAHVVAEEGVKTRSTSRRHRRRECRSTTL
jgi:hypothetical protein